MHLGPAIWRIWIPWQLILSCLTPWSCYVMHRPQLIPVLFLTVFVSAVCSLHSAQILKALLRQLYKMQTALAINYMGLKHTNDAPASQGPLCPRESQRFSCHQWKECWWCRRVTWWSWPQPGPCLNLCLMPLRWTVRWYWRSWTHGSCHSLTHTSPLYAWALQLSYGFASRVNDHFTCLHFK